MGFGLYLATGGGIRIGEDDPEEEDIFRDLWEDETQREIVIDCLKAYSARSGWEDLGGFER
jgi:hypothetical protein